MHQALQQS